MNKIFGIISILFFALNINCAERACNWSYKIKADTDNAIIGHFNEIKKELARDKKTNYITNAFLQKLYNLAEDQKIKSEILKFCEKWGIRIAIVNGKDNKN